MEVETVYHHVDVQPSAIPEAVRYVEAMAYKAREKEAAQKCRWCNHYLMADMQTSGMWCDLCQRNLDMFQPQREALVNDNAELLPVHVALFTTPGYCVLCGCPSSLNDVELCVSCATLAVVDSLSGAPPPVDENCR